MIERPKAHQPPPLYRAYRVSARGRVQGVGVVLDASDDEQALQQARKLVDGIDIELWDRARRVAVLLPRSEAVT